MGGVFEIFPKQDRSERRAIAPDAGKVNADKINAYETCACEINAELAAETVDRDVWTGAYLFGGSDIQPGPKPAIDRSVSVALCADAQLGFLLNLTSAGEMQTRASRNAGGGPLDVFQGMAARMANDDRKRRNEPSGPGTSVITKTKPQTKRPSMYRVLLLNDDYTPMEFVVHVLERFFNKDRDAATNIMMHVHQHGVGECGIYTYEVAETKVTQVMDFSRKHQHPLQCVMEKK